MKNDKLTIRLDDGTIRIFAGRDAWTLRHLIAAGQAGLTTIDHPAPRWSHYVFRLRKAGLVISTVHEPHNTGLKPPSPTRRRRWHEVRTLPN
jgi:hypothetical protein